MTKRLGANRAGNQEQKMKKNKTCRRARAETEREREKDPDIGRRNRETQGAEACLKQRERTGERLQCEKRRKEGRR